MIQICKRCRRVNPREAAYCHFDGALLEGHGGGDIPSDGSAINVGLRPFTVPLVFPSGRACANFLQLATVCQKEPAAVLELLRRGTLETFLAGQGRVDLASAARAAGRAADKERGLDDFLGRLPVPLPPARLRVEPEQLDMGTVRVGEDRRFELTLHNDGKRLLYGAAGCAAPWLVLGDGPATPSKVFQFSSRNVLPVRVVGRKLGGYDKPRETEILIESSGGNVTVPVRVFVPVKPFSEGVLSGAQSPRQLAQKAKEAPKEAAALIESGAVARWYEANGWTYPVLGPTAAGVAAVQQLFEALGLVKPPRVELSEEAIRLGGRPGEKIEYSLAVITQESRAAIAHGTCDQPWLQITRTVFRGRNAFLLLTIPAVPACPGETLHAQITVVANGGQRFLVPVSLVIGQANAPAPAPASRQVPVKPVERRTPVAFSPALEAVPAAPVGSRWVKRTLVLACLLAVATLLVLGWHLLQELRGPAPPPASATLTVAFQEDPKDAVGAATMTFGLTLSGEQDAANPRQHKRLTYDDRGRTNNTCYRLDGKEVLLGYEGGSWQTLCEPIGAGDAHSGCRSVWLHKAVPVAFTQTVQVIVGPQSGRPDTCLVRYTIENRDKAAHKVGLRFLLDTFIGAHDGVPFAVPGKATLCDTSCDLQGADVPDFLQALELEELGKPGVVAHLGLRPGAGLESPRRLTIGAWPDVKLTTVDKRAQGNLTRWEVPVGSLKQQADSAVTLYWPEENLAPGAHRELGFSYGLGSVAGADGQGRLAVALGGAFTPGSELTVVAYLKNPAKGETLTLELPAGFKLVHGPATVAVPEPPASATWPISLTTWKIQSPPGAATSGRFLVRSSSGVSQAYTLTVSGGNTSQ